MFAALLTVKGNKNRRFGMLSSKKKRRVSLFND
jgi:hypothetical protein